MLYSKYPVWKVYNISFGKSMQYFDTHAHIGLICEDPIEQLIVIQEARQAQVTRIVSICNSLHDFVKVYDNLKSANHVYHAVGVSPSEVQNPGKDWVQTIEQSAQLPRVVAVGEIGLDYYRKFGDKKSQIELFITQLDLAAKLDLPVIIHNRDAGKDVIEILKDRLPPRGGVLHCYSEDAEYARRALDLNLYFSFAGNLTYRNAKNLHETIGVLPLDRILIESESPFMVPADYRGKRNMPKYLPITAHFLADMLEMGDEEMADTLWDNSSRFFNLPRE
ncbi:hydrolase, TatD family [Leadbettera azotonutricia ZAS-9]|uniref:Hydrolase, TatD family n=2 Tax=Leadbettera azotonutricia TaxID=150829 RepID=F5Y8N4_LEAAZ|nr:hydrolase, TatD family [Leadbettera azotonutricia ZAS-9]